MRRFGLFLLAVAGSAPSCATAQTLTRPEPMGDYRLEFQDLDGVQRVMTIQATDLISPVITSNVAATSSGLVYTYSVTNAPDVRAHPDRGVWLWMAPCGARGATVATAAPTGWHGEARDLGDAKICEFQAIRDETILNPGQSATGFTVTSAALPGTGQVRVRGLGDVPGWPVETDRVAAPILRLVDSVAGMSYYDHAGVVVWAVLPLRSPASITSGSIAITLLQSDLTAQCGSLGWIARRGICQSLRAKLEAARGAYGRGQTETAHNQLQAFKSELAAQRGKAVNESAFAMLSALVDFTVGRF